MIINPYTKEAYDMPPVDLLDGLNVNEAVRNIYKTHKGNCERFLFFIDSADNKVRRYYVYAWYAKTDPKRYFYVGKGTGCRWRHILSDIGKYKSGKHNIRFQRYSQIQEKWGIDCEIVIEKLTEYEALIFEECKKLELLMKGEVLLNLEGIPEEYLLHDWEGESAVSPSLQKSPFFRRYLDDIGEPFFDSVDFPSLLRTYFYPYYLDTEDETVIFEKTVIEKWLQSHNAKIYRTVSPKTQSVIIQGVLRYDRYAEYRNKGIKIFSSKDVIEYISMGAL